MKKTLLIAFMIILALEVQAQELKTLEVGTIVTIEKPSGQEFQHIHFPKKNFIIKRGGIVNYKREFGNEVEIVSLETKKDGIRQARLKRGDGKKFFQSHTSVLVDLDKAIAAGEISI
ncbi:hypothetical protein LZ575_18715 [Antarcticibacterium sp. 1MA-6-2]|uniref:hypothetical protein n=1 Tax=Antarcticibacterium sp. 1MA-6-2 TaxID=2908210 RepID=UPI001F1919BD|nr:hypothetical protein [Antarcticibacterium sp. 1MA-6-2]UJH90766.1 hypothetical protein LZ575_18715 [Antarcticibacterium sp. 1MA-6-2]